MGEEPDLAEAAAIFASTAWGDEGVEDTEYRINQRLAWRHDDHDDGICRHREDPVADAWNAGNAKPLKHEDPVGRRKTALYRITVFTLFCLHVHVHCRVYIM